MKTKKFARIFKLWAAMFAIVALSAGFASCSDDSGGGDEYTPPETTYTITFNANDGTDSPATTTQTFSAGSVTLKSNTFTRTGCTFLGWSESASATKATYSDGQSAYFYRDTTLYAVWQLPASTYAITFDGNGGATSSGATTKTQTVTSTASKPQVTLDANPFTKSGSVFLGWALSASSSYVSYADGATYTFLSTNKSVTLYAVWADEANAVTITLDANDGSGSTKTINAVKNQSIYFSNYAGIFTQDYATLTGFKKDADGEKADYSVSSYSSMTVTEATTLYAHWMENPKITFDANGGTAGDGGTEAYQYLAGSYEYSGLLWTFVPENETTASTGKEIVTLNENTFTRDGYAFKGWATNAGLTTAQYEDKGSYTFTRSTVFYVEVWSEPTLYAVWKKIPTITYSTNGGSTTATFTEKSLTVTNTTPAAKYSYYSFEGWSTSSSAASATYAAGDELNFASDTVTLYAVWKIGTIVSAKSISVARSTTETVASFTLLKSESVKLTIGGTVDDYLTYVAKNSSGTEYEFGKFNAATTTTKTLPAGTYTFTAKNAELIGDANTATVTLKGN